MKEIKIFDGLKVKEENGQLLFDAEEAARMIGLVKTSKGNTYVRWERVNEYALSTFGQPEIKRGDFITEQQVYKIAIKANSQQAEKFQDWLTTEVLPSIRKTGGYQIHPQFNLPQTLPEALRLSADLAEQNAELKPKAELHDKFIATAGAINLTATSKELNVKRNDLVDKLLNHGYIYRTKGHSGILQPMKKYVPKLFALKSGGYNPDGIEFTPQMLITPYGREVIYKKFYSPDQTELDMEA